MDSVELNNNDEHSFAAGHWPIVDVHRSPQQH